MKDKHAGFWSYLTSSLQNRPIISIYNHIKRLYDTRSKKGQWTPEEDKLLVRGVKEFGRSWIKVGEVVDRLPGDCRDRWRDYIEVREKNTLIDSTTTGEDEVGKKGKKDKAKKGKEKGKEKEMEKEIEIGKWNEEELKELEKLVKKYGHNWITISKKMKSRTKTQCRLKWLVLPPSSSAFFCSLFPFFFFRGRN